MHNFLVLEWRANALLPREPLVPRELLVPREPLVGREPFVPRETLLPGLDRLWQAEECRMSGDRRPQDCLFRQGSNAQLPYAEVWCCSPLTCRAGSVSLISAASLVGVA